jgi:putative spermidine/putrescine transport system ATP-binding protein
VGEGEDSAIGTVREVVYVGSGTRYVVDLEVGGSLVALQQNQRSTSMDVMGMRGRQVRLVWRKEHEYRVG